MPTIEVYHRNIFRAFEDPEFFAAQIGVPTELVERIANIWLALTSYLHLDPEKFYKYCQDTKKLYTECVPWNYPAPTMHKIWDHSHIVLRHMPVTLTFGQLSEEPTGKQIQRLN